MSATVTTVRFVDGGAARSELWRRYDSGAIDADELESRLKLLDRTPVGDAESIRRAVDGSVPVRRRRSTRTVVLVAVGVLGVGVVSAGALALVAAVGDDTGPAATGNDIGVFGVNRGVAVAVPPPIPIPVPPPDCDAFTALGEENGSQFGDPEPPANPALLSDPPYVPEGYELVSNDEITPGTDPDVAMATSAGSTLPKQILGRSLSGAIPVRMRAFVFDSVETAEANSEGLARSGLCDFSAEPFDVADRPELFGTVVRGVIPTTAFVSFTLGERRVIVAAEAGNGGDVEAARLLAGEIAGAEYDAARAPPPAG